MTTLTLAAEARELDRLTMEEVGVPGVALMEVAGKGATDALCRRLERGRARIAIFCGAGNNGGDGYVMARHLLARGHLPEVFLLASPERIEGDAAVNLAAAHALSIPIHRLDDEALDEAAFEAALDAFERAPWVACVDALLGTGLSSPVRGRFAQAIEAINAVRVPVVAVDIPSGLSADTGQPLGAAVEATLTVTFGCAKPGLVLYPGRDLVGDVEVIDLGFPPQVHAQVRARGQALTVLEALAQLAPRPRDTHKGHCGHALVLGGAPGKSGASILAGCGALDMGAGLVTVGTHPDHVQQIALARWALMSESLLPVGSETLTGVEYEALVAWMERADVIAAGPGLGVNAAVRSLVTTLLEQFPGPLVLDADALNVLADTRASLSQAKGDVIITPHPGEMARLTGLETRVLLEDRLGCALSFARDHGVIVVLKSGSTVVAHPDGRYAINTTGNPGMATAGMGDVLTGMIAGLLAQGFAPWVAACVSVCLHGHAGDLGAARYGDLGLTADRLLKMLPEATQPFDPVG